MAADTVILRDTTYCAGRTRSRAQQLIADGYKRGLVDELSSYNTPGEEGIEQARDTVAETSTARMNGGGDNEERCDDD